MISLLIPAVKKKSEMWIAIHFICNWIFIVFFFWSIMVPFHLFFLSGWQAVGRAATSLSKLADTAREELPSTMAAIRLSGMEISDLTLELSDLRWQSSSNCNSLVVINSVSYFLLLFQWSECWLRVFCIRQAYMQKSLLASVSCVMSYKQNMDSLTQ